MDKELIKALTELGKQAAILYKNALEESRNEQIAKNVVHEYMAVIIKPDSNKFFMQ